MRTVNYELQTPVPYTPDKSGGVESEGSFIELSEPTGRIAHLVAILKSEIGKGALGAQAATAGLEEATPVAAEPGKPDEPEPDPDNVGETLYTVLMMGGADLAKVLITFKEILKLTAKMEAERPMTAPMIDRMTYDDLEGCLKKYIGNFTPAS